MEDGKLTLELCSATHPAVEVSVTEVVLPGEAGVFTVLPGHTPMLTTLTEGVVIAYNDDEDPSYYAVHRGFCEVADNKVMVLAEQMEVRGAIDEERARAALDQATQLLLKPTSEINIAQVEAAAARAQARLQTHARSDY